MELLFAADNLDNLLPIVISGVLGIGLIVVIWYVCGGKKGNKEAEKSPEPCEENEAVEDNAVGEERRPKKASKQFARKPSYSHALLAATLKGHTGQILDADFDSRGKYLLSCSEGAIYNYLNNRILVTDFHHSVYNSVPYKVEYQFSIMIIACIAT